MVLMVLIFMLVGCTESPATNNTTQGETPQAPVTEAPVSETDTNDPLVVEHAFGTETFEEIPQRVVVLEWSLAEAVLALGMQPVGMADINGYEAWVNVAPELVENVVDVGTRQEPNLEVIASLQPDLILTVDFRARNAFDQLQAIAPTIVFGSEFEENLNAPYNYMLTTFQTIAEILDKKQEGEAVLASLENTFANARQQLKAAGKDGAEFVVAQAWSNQNAAVMRLFTDNSLVVELLHEIGLKNAFESDAYQPNGFETTSVEGLVGASHAHFLYVVQDDDNIFENQLKDNAVWNGLDFVKENRHYSLGGDMWLFGGPISSERVIHTVVELLTQ